MSVCHMIQRQPLVAVDAPQGHPIDSQSPVYRDRVAPIAGNRLWFHAYALSLSLSPNPRAFAGGLRRYVRAFLRREGLSLNIPNPALHGDRWSTPRVFEFLYE